MPAKDTSVTAPNYGVYLGQPSITIPKQGLEDCLNVRIKRSKLSSFLMGWVKFTTQQLNGPVTLLDNFFKSDGSSFLIAGTLTDLYQYNTGSNLWVYITPRYETGTAASAGTAVTGVGTLWNTTNADGRKNVLPGDEISFGATGVTATGATWFPVLAVIDDTHLTLSTTSGVIGAGVYTIRRKFQSANIFNYWVTETFPRADKDGTGVTIEDEYFATNRGIDYPVRWDGNATQVTILGTLQFKAKEIRRFKNQMWYLNCADDSGAQKPGSVKISDVGRPVTMVGGIAAEFVAAPGTAAIVTSLPIGDNLAIYTENEVVMATFVGAAEIITFRTSVNGTGLIAGRLVAQFTDTHQFMGRDALYSFNGIQAEALDSHVWISWLRQQDQNRIRASHLIFDEENGVLIWALTRADDAGAATNGPPEKALEAHYLEDLPNGVNTPYMIRQFPFSIAGFFSRSNVIRWSDLTLSWPNYAFSFSDRILAAAFPLLLAADNNGFVYTLNTIDTQNGAGYASYVTFPRRFLGSYRTRDMVRRVYLMCKQLIGTTYNLLVTTSVYDHEGQTSGTNIQQGFDMTLAGNHFVSPYKRGRLGQVQVGTLGSTVGQGWELHGYDWDILRGGGA